VGNVGDIVNVKWNSRSDLITHIFELIKLMSIISIVGAIFAFVEKPGFNRLVLIILLVISLMAVLTLGGSRRHLIWILLISLFLIHYFIRRISVIHVLLLFVLMLLVVIAGDILRSSGFTMSALLVRPEASDLLRGNTEYNAAHGILMELFARKNEMVFLNGQSIVKPILAIIPREIYPSKPIPITQLMAELIYPNQVGHSVGASFFGEMYFNFSYFGALASFFYGWLVSYVSRRLEYMMNLYHTKTKRITIELLFFVILYLSLFNFFRGPFADSFYFIIAFILILSPYLKIIVRRRN